MATLTYRGNPIPNATLNVTLYVSAYRISANYVRVELSSSSTYLKTVPSTINPQANDTYVGVYASYNGTSNRLHYISNKNISGNFPYGYADFYVGTGSSFTFSFVINFSVGNVGGANVNPSPSSVIFTVGAGSFTVSYNKNHSATSVSNMPSAQTKYYGETLTLSSTKPKAASTSSKITVSFNGNGGTGVTAKSANATTSYTFNNWNTEPGGGGTRYNAGASYTYNSSSILYAQWTKTNSAASINLPTTTRNKTTGNGWKITYNPNGGSSTPNPSYAVDNLSYTFNSWNTKSDGSGTKYLGNTTYGFSANTTLYAQWTENRSRGNATLASAIKRNNGDAENGAVIKYYSDTNTPVKTQQTTKIPTYTFKGWKIGNTTYDANVSYKPENNITAAAQWNEIYKPNTVYALGAEAITAPEGQILAGWSTSNTSTTIVYKPGAPITTLDNLNLYAVWTDGKNYVLTHNGLLGYANKWSAALEALDNPEIREQSVLWPVVEKDGESHFGTVDIPGKDYKYVTYKGSYIGKLNTDGSIKRTTTNDGFSTGGTWYYKEP